MTTPSPTRKWLPLAGVIAIVLGVDALVWAVLAMAK